ncbi:MAG: hypothetical protein ACPG4Y_07530 [Chitinophagales bacterium]
MKNIFLAGIFIFFATQEVLTQTLLEKRIENLKEEIKLQDKKIAKVEISPVMFDLLAKLKIDSSKIDLNNFNERKQIVLLQRLSKAKNGFLGMGIGFNVFGTVLMGLGGNIIYRTRNNREGFGMAIGSLAVTFGTLINVGTIPMHVSSSRKSKKFKIIKENLLKHKGF